MGGCRVLIACALVALVLASSNVVVAAPGATSVAGPAFWEDRADANISADGLVHVSGTDAAGTAVASSGALIHVSGDFRITATLQAATSSLAALMVDDVALGLEDGRAVLGASTADLDAPLGPATLELARVGDDLVERVSGAEVAREPYPFTDSVLKVGTRVAAGNELTLHVVDVAGDVTVDRCAPERLLAAGSDAPELDAPSSLWWVPLAGDAPPRRVEIGGQRAYLVSLSPDRRWVTYYQRSPRATPDKFLADTWVLNLATDERFKLADSSTPIGWSANSRGVILGEHPDTMALVPSGEPVPTEGPIVASASLRGADSPDGQVRAVVSGSTYGVEGVDLLDRSSGDLVMHVATGRAAVQLAWSPDSARLAFTNGTETASSPTWRLRMVDVGTREVSTLASTRDFELHSVVWVPALPACGAAG
jgi:hypothetical protein